MPVFDPATSVALLVGIAEYKKTDLFGALPWVENNLKALTALLLDRDVFGFQAENVFERLNLNNGDIAEELDAIRGRPEPRYVTCLPIVVMEWYRAGVIF